MISTFYDKFSPSSIEAYAKQLEGKTFSDIISTNPNHLAEASPYYHSNSFKGNLGHLLEEHYFDLTINSDAEPDFKEAGVELKVTPFKQNKNGSFSAKERLVITIINYMDVIHETFDCSHLRSKTDTILLIYYQYLQGIAKLDYPIKYVQLFQIPEEDLGIIKSDFEIIIDKIKEGKAHELSEGDTYYLGACTKGATAATSTRQQPCSDIPAKQRAFCFKTSYMTYILNNYIMPRKSTYDKINYVGNFEQHILSTVNNRIGTSVDTLIDEFEINYTRRPKQLESSLILRILGVRSNDAEEFVKAGIKVKTIRLEANDTLKETVSLPAFDFIEMANELWDDATINNYLSETKFLFVVFKKDSEYEHFAKIKDYSNMDKHLSLYYTTFWNMSQSDINHEVKEVWKRTQAILREGIQTEQHGARTFNNLPSSKENRICHIRPHAKDKTDVLPLPTGGSFVKQSFFLNREYVLNEIMDKKMKQGI